MAYLDHVEEGLFMAFDALAWIANAVMIIASYLIGWPLALLSILMRCVYKYPLRRTPWQDEAP